MDSPYPRKSSPKVPILIRYIAGAILIAILFIFGYLPKRANSQTLNTAANEEATSAPEVQIVTPRMAAPDALELPGNIEAISTTSVQARTTGYVTKLMVDIGSKVKAGQVLAEIQSPDVDQQFAQANADTERSRATVGESRANVDRLQAGVSQGLADISHQRAGVAQSQAAVEGAHARKAQAEAGLLQAKAKLIQSQQQVGVQKAALAQAEANFALAQANEKRYAELLQKGFVAQEDYDQAEATFKTNSALVDSAKASISASEADVSAAQEVISSNRALIRSAASDEQAAIQNVKAAQASLESSSANLQAAKSSVVASKSTVLANQAAVGSSIANSRRYGVIRGFQHVVAPFDGIITSRNVDIGSLVSPGQTVSTDQTNTTPSTGLFGIARVDTLRLFVSLPQTNYQLAKAGEETKIKVREIPNKVFSGVVRQSAGALDSSTRTLLTEIRVPNPGDILLPGMYAQVEFSSGDDKKLRVPSSALVVDAKGTSVVVMDSQHKIHHKVVVLGRDYGTEAEVISGIEATDRLIANPSDDLTDGQTVQVVDDKGKKSS